MFTTSQILKQIGCKHLKLVNGKGYWYFIFDNNVAYETHSVYTMRLNDLKIEEWIGEGKEFVDAMYTGKVCLEGPHYPAAHSWYAEGEMVDGILVKVK